MGAYIVRRTLISFFTILVISFFSFVIIQLPEGDYVDWYIDRVAAIAGDIGDNSDEYKEEMRAELGLNKPIVAQYWNWISRIIFKADFGYGYFAGERHSIKQIMIDTVPITILLTGFTITITWIFAIPIGVYSAIRQNSIGDYTFTLLGFTGLAVPDFLLGLVLMYLFFSWFGHSVGGLFSGDYESAAWSMSKVLDMLQHLIIPGIVMGTSGTAGLIRIMRNNLLDEIQKPYVTTALAKGMVKWKVIAKYPMRVAINPFISGIGGMLPALIGGSVIVSIVLSLPTLGPILLKAISTEDRYVAGAIILMLASLTVLGVLISDLFLILIDPRIKLTGRHV